MTRPDGVRLTGVRRTTPLQVSLHLEIELVALELRMDG